MKLPYFLFLIVSLSITASNAADKVIPGTAPAPVMGNEIGNGGDPCLQAAWVTRRLLKSALENQTFAQFPEVNEARFWQILNETDLAIANDLPYCAVNFSQAKLIVFRVDCFCEIHPDQRVPLMFHEILSVMGLEKTGDYSISSRLKYRYLQVD